jgi:hypothetical protein
MVLAEGRWAWWNGYGSLPVEHGVRRAREARLRGVIVKWGHPQARDAFARGGVAVATERYVYPGQPEVEARRLAEDVAAGARFAVINAEAEWERVGPEPMRHLIAEFRRLQPQTELYASVDTRGGRMALPYQRELAEHVAGWMPMVYPAAFYPGRPPGFIERAFRDALDGKDFGGKPVLPAVQTYDGIGANAVAAQLAEARRRGLAGYQAYTIAHATDEEWAVLVRDAEEETMATLEELQRELDQQRNIEIVVGMAETFAGYVRQRMRLPEEIMRRIEFIFALSRARPD